MEHFLYEGEKVAGPFTSEQIRQRLAAKEISSDTLIQPVGGTSSWVPLSNYTLDGSLLSAKLPQAQVPPSSQSYAVVSNRLIKDILVSKAPLTVPRTVVYIVGAALAIVSLEFLVNRNTTSDKINALEAQINELKSENAALSLQVNPSTSPTNAAQQGAGELSLQEKFQSDPPWLRITIYRAMTGSNCVKAHVFDNFELEKAQRSNKRLIYFDASVANMSGEQLLVSYQNFTLQDTEGGTYETSLSNDPLQVEVETGKSGRGGVGFAIPNGVTPAALIYDPRHLGAFIGHHVYCRCDIQNIAKMLGFKVADEQSISAKPSPSEKSAVVRMNNDDVGQAGLSSESDVIEYLKIRTQWPGDGDITPDKVVRQWARDIMGKDYALEASMGAAYVRSEGGHDKILKQQTDLYIDNCGVRKR